MNLKIKYIFKKNPSKYNINKKTAIRKYAVLGYGENHIATY
jgi:hypothetical protein